MERKARFKKLLNLGLVFLLVISLSGCSKTDSAEKTDVKDDFKEELTEEVEKEEKEEVEEVKKDIPKEYESALKKAEIYSDTMHMSKAGIYDQLVSEYGENFSEEAAQYAIDNIQADWKANALEKAKIYQDTMHMAPEAIRDQLTSEYGEGFTQEEADYAVEQLTGSSSSSTSTASEGVPKEYESALKKAETYSDTMHMSKVGIYDQLVSEYGENFSEEAAQYAIDNIQADWKANALEKAKIYQDTMDMSPEAIRDQLTSEYGEGFTKEEADYAIKNL